ncbi:MAG: phenylalanine--tRNA ligase subunit alpha [Candidatus Pacearchaeota archaeon]
MFKDINKTLDSLSPNERKILPYLEEKSVTEICKKSNLDSVSVIRSLEYLKNKGVVQVSISQEKIVDMGINGILYKKKGLPERRLLNILNEKRIIELNDAKKQSNLSEDEFKASLGILKKNNLIELKNGKVIFSADKVEIARKLPAEIFLESLPLDYESMNKEQKDIFDSLKKRKEIIKVEEKKIVNINVTEFGKKIIESLEKLNGNLIEQITPQILIKDSLWKGKKFRRYDVSLPVPSIYGGKRHIISQAADYARKIWIEMGFQEMNGDMIQTSFWNFDSLFTAQDHPVRDMQDTFFFRKTAELPNKKIVKLVKESHEKGVSGSKGWGYKWNEEESKRLVLRTHTTCLSAKTLANLDFNQIPKKFFALGRCFRNETIDWSHGFEFNQTEGIVIDLNANFRHLLGYLKVFFSKMGFEKIRFRPSYFPYTEPSVEIDVFNPEKKIWLELGGAGIFRPEVVVPLLGKNIPVLAWGPGFDRMIMNYYGIKDLRDLYKNNLNQIRKMKFWIK